MAGHGPSMTLIAGFAGSGKSLTSRMLAELTSWALLDKDTLTRPLVERLLTELGGDPHDRESPLYLDHVRPLEYQCLLRAGLDNLEVGVSSILSAPFIREVSDAAWLRRTHGRCVALGGRLNVVWIAVDVASQRQRLVSRDADRDRWKLANWDEYLRAVDPGLRPVGPHLVLDNSAVCGSPLGDQVAAFARRLRAGADQAEAGQAEAGQAEAGQ